VKNKNNSNFNISLIGKRVFVKREDLKKKKTFTKIEVIKLPENLSQLRKMTCFIYIALRESEPRFVTVKVHKNSSYKLYAQQECSSNASVIMDKNIPILTKFNELIILTCVVVVSFSSSTSNGRLINHC